MERSLRLGKLNTGLIASLALFAFAVTSLVLLNGRDETAAASSGGVTLATPEPAQTTPAGGKALGARFGNRILREGMTGPDVRVLKSIVRSKRLLRGTTVSTRFDRPTTSAVRRFQSKANMTGSGVVNPATAKAMVRSLGTGHASWYGPGLYGNGTACGKVTLRPKTIGLAHKTLPCGTRVLIGFRGKYIVAPVIDRGPYIAGRTWDLTAAAAKAVGLTSAGVGNVRHAIISRGK